MKLKKLLNSLLFLTIFSGSILAQDIHFTNWDMAPLTINPAFSGAYSGTARIGGIYRDQWRSLPSADFSTPNVMIDAPIIRGIRKNDWVGIGLNMFQDKAGTFDLGYSAQYLSAAYHLGLNKKSTSTLTLGIQWGSTNRDLTVPDGLAVLENRNESFIDNTEESNYTEYKGGLLFKTMMGKTSDMAVGFSVGHLFEPNYGLDSSALRPALIQAHGQFNLGMTKKWTLSPQVLFQSTGTASEISLQAWNGYKWDEKYTFRGGLGYRANDMSELQFLLGADYKENVRITAAWDYSLGDLAGNSGFEVAAWYIIKIFKKPDVDPKILCPKL